MARVEVWKCDGCGKLIERAINVYTLNLKAVGKMWAYDGWEQPEIELHFCGACAMRLLQTLEKIAKRLEDRSELNEKLREVDAK